MRTIKKLVFFVLLGFAIFLFCYFRIKPLYYQTVPYTFDQGRDFLRVESIVLDKNLTFIGPEAGGLAGVFHGAWWYYFLSIPFILTGGNPIGFSSFIFVVNLLSVSAFCYFLIKKFDIKVALIFFLLVALSPYFTGISIFAINSGMTLPFLLLFIFSSYEFLNRKSNFYLFLVFLSLGFIAEAELPFGIFLFPSFLLTTLITKKIKLFFGTFRKIGFIILGLLIPFSLRMLFELKNGFMQTRNLLSAIFDRSVAGNVDIIGLFNQRLDLFFNYYYIQIFAYGNKILAYAIGLNTLLILGISYKKISQIYKPFYWYLIVLTTSLFFLSFIYKETFYANYFEGYPYFFVLLISLSFAFVNKKAPEKYLSTAVIVILFAVGLFSFIKDVSQTNIVHSGGLQEQVSTVKALKLAREDSCVRIYTPPVIPYTYNYLFSYYARINKQQKPGESYVKNQCWYIIEKDQYSFRIKDWRDLHIPKKARLIKKEVLSDNITIELWKRN